MSLYPWMTKKEVLKYIEEIIIEDVSERARKKDGFLNMFLLDKDLNQNYPNKKHSYIIERNNFIKRHLKQYQENPTYRRYLALIAWAYLPKSPPPLQPAVSVASLR